MSNYLRFPVKNGYKDNPPIRYRTSRFRKFYVPCCKANLAVENLPIGFSALQHLGVDTKSLFQYKTEVLDGTDCLAITFRPSFAHVIRLITVLRNSNSNEQL